MSRCPYPETFTNPISGKTETNSLYTVWHEGYEAHKLELMDRVQWLEVCMRELCRQITQIKELKRELEKQKTEL